MSLRVKQTLGISIRTARKKEKLTQRSLADAIGVRQSTVSRWESGIDMPNMKNLEDLVRVLNCSYDDLLSFLPVENEDEAKLISIYRSLSKEEKSKLLTISKVIADNKLS